MGLRTWLGLTKHRKDEHAKDRKPVVIAVTRFSVVNPLTLPAMRLTSGLDRDEARRRVYDPVRMRERMRLFETLALPSALAAARRYRRFFHLVLISSDLPAPWKSILAEKLRGSGRSRILELSESESPFEKLRDAVAEIAAEGRAVTFGLDDDEAFAPAYIDAVLDRVHGRRNDNAFSVKCFLALGPNQTFHDRLSKVRNHTHRPGFGIASSGAHPRTVFDSWGMLKTANPSVGELSAEPIWLRVDRAAAPGDPASSESAIAAFQKYFRHLDLESVRSAAGSIQPAPFTRPPPEQLSAGKRVELQGQLRQILENALVRSGGTVHFREDLVRVLANVKPDWTAIRPHLDILLREPDPAGFIYSLKSAADLWCDDPDAALETIRSGIRRRRRDFRLYDRMSVFLRLLDRMADERRQLLDRLSAEGSSDNWRDEDSALLMRIAIDSGDTDEAERLLTERSQKRSDDLMARAALAGILESRHELGEAAGLSAEVLVQNPGHWMARAIATSVRQQIETAELLRAHRDRGARTRSNERSRVALLLSGFVRDFAHINNIAAFVARWEADFQIDIFAQAFDRLGDLRVPYHLPPSLSDYDHGGFYREIQKTPPLNRDKFISLLNPTACIIEPRLPDDVYLAEIGMAHPQWLKVLASFELLDRHVRETGAQYAAVVRGRYDVNLSNLDLKRAAIRPKAVLTPSNLIWGTNGYELCDRLAIGGYEEMRTYCSIGRGRNFLDLEKDARWRQELSGHVNFHETHLAYWLKQNGIAIEQPEWLTI